MSCPYCNSPVLLNDWVGNTWYKCGTTNGVRSESCVDREPIAADLRNALARIKRLEAALSELLMWLGEDISDSNRQLLEDHCRKAKEAKP